MSEPKIFVVTAEGLEAAGEALYLDTIPTGPMTPWSKLSAQERSEWCDRARAALEAAGIQYVDEFWEVDCLATIKVRDEDKPHTKLLMYGLLPGDRLYIQRGEWVRAER